MMRKIKIMLTKSEVEGLMKLVLFADCNRMTDPYMGVLVAGHKRGLVSKLQTRRQSFPVKKRETSLTLRPDALVALVQLMRLYAMADLAPFERVLVLKIEDTVNRMIV